MIPQLIPISNSERRNCLLKNLDGSFHEFIINLKTIFLIRFLRSDWNNFSSLRKNSIWHFNI